MDKINSLINLAKDDGEKLFIKKIIDKVERTYNNNYIEYTEFLDPGQIYLAKCIVNTLKTVDIYFEGGYENAERQRGILIPSDYYTKEFDSHINVLKLTASKFSRELTHRDFLGSLLGLGIKREVIGDILVSEDNTAYVIVIDSIKNYLFDQLKKVSREHIEIDIVDSNVLNSLVEKVDYDEKIITVSSVRLDSIIGGAYNISRSIAANMIKQGKVKVNYRLEDSTHYTLENRDLLSVRGYGRCKIVDILGETRKGRTRLKIYIYK